MRNWNITSYGKKKWSFIIFKGDFWRYLAKSAENS